ncbi:MAG: phospholipase D-like domain-containing protein, partial [archaeon]|nr:phospholipase D-like domain-containing protein [archaeon]
MDCFKKTLALAAVICLVSTSAVLFVQSDSSDASEITWYDAEVTPFTFPECEGIPILKTLKQATKSVDISIYLLSSKYALSILLEKQSEGVQVRLLIEGEPLDVDLDSLTETRIMKNLVDAGADVHVINYPGCT